METSEFSKRFADNGNGRSAGRVLDMEGYQKLSSASFRGSPSNYY